MTRARSTRATVRVARVVLALFGVLGSVACGRSGQAGARQGPIDAASTGSMSWPGFEPAAQRPLTDADVEQIATKLARDRVPRISSRLPTKGPDTARVAVQLFSDFECPFCVQAAPAFDELEQRYRGQIRLIWRNYPLPMHARARPAARAASAAFALGGNAQFWKLHDWLYSEQADLSDAGLIRAATQLSLDVASIEQAIHSKQYDAAIDADVAAADAAGLEGTPAAYINDYYVMGARSADEYAVVINRALHEAP